MADVINRNTGIALEKETVSGTYVAPTGGASFISPLEDGVNELTVQNKELLERTNVTSSLDRSLSRSGIKSPSGSIPLEFKSGDNAALPEYGVLLESGLGTTNAGSTGNTSGSGHTTTVINFASTSAFTVGDIVLVKESGAYHVSPITAIVTDTSIELLVAMSGAPADAVVVDVLANYTTADSGHPSFSVTKYNTGSDIESAATVETAAGCKSTSITLENWSTGQFPTMSVAYEGLSYTHETGTSSYTPVYDSSLPVVALKACIYKDGVELPMNDFSVAIENTAGYKTTTCSENGRVDSRITARNISGTVNPYKADNSVAEWDDWNEDTSFSLFAYAYNPTSTSGEFNEIVSIYLPVCQYTEVTQSDNEGLAQNAFAFAAKKDDTLPTATIAFG